MSRRSWLLVSCSMVLLLLQGCSLMSDVAGCALEPAGERGGVVTRVTQFTEAGAVQLAAAHCRQYGLVAQVTGMLYGQPDMEFVCVASH
jgi:hypothetical protein